MSSAQVLIGMGGNLGDVGATFEKAVLLLSSDLFDIQMSSIHSTVPCYDKPGAEVPEIPDPPYKNAVMCARTFWSPHDLMARLLDVERVLGRVRPAPLCSPRTLDLDLLLYGEQIIHPDSEHDLEIPHPRMHTRSFVLIPACEIAPEMVHPVFNRTILDLCNDL